MSRDCIVGLRSGFAESHFDVNSRCKKLHTYPQKWPVRRNRHSTIAEQSAGWSDSSGRRMLVAMRFFTQVEMHSRSDDE